METLGDVLLQAIAWAVVAFFVLTALVLAVSELLMPDKDILDYVLMYGAWFVVWMLSPLYIALALVALAVWLLVLIVRGMPGVWSALKEGWREGKAKSDARLAELKAQHPDWNW